MIHCPRGLPSARVAPQRCPILLTDDDSISHFFDFFHTTIEIVLDMGYIAEWPVVSGRYPVAKEVLRT